MIKVITNKNAAKITAANAILDRLYDEGDIMGYTPKWSSAVKDGSLMDERPCKIKKHGTRRIIAECDACEDQKIMVIPVNGRTTVRFSDKTYLFNPESVSKADVFRDNTGIARLLVFRLHKGAESVKLSDITGEFKEFTW